MVNRTRKVGLVLLGVVLTAALGTGVLLFTGSSVGAGIVVVGVPVLLATGVAGYVRFVVNRGSVGATEFQADRARNVATTFREELTALGQLQRRYPGWDASDVETRARQVADDFESAGVRVDVDAATFTVEDPENPRTFDELERSVAGFATARDESFVAYAETELERTRAAVRRLEPDVLSSDEIDTVSPSALPDDATDAEGAAKTLDRARDRAAETVQTAVDRIESTTAEYDADPTTIRERLREAERLADEGDIPGAVEEIQRATDTVESATEDEFGETRTAVTALIETVRDSVVDDYVDREHVEAVDDVAADVESIGSAMETARLDEARTELRERCRTMVRQLHEDLDRHVDTIAAADVPVGFYSVPPAAGTDHVGQLREAEDLETFRQTWVAAVGELTEAVAEAEQKASVADSYEMVADEMAESLQTNGRVTGGDVPVRQPAQFMELYAETNDEVTYDAAGPTLTVPGGGQTYTVSVTATLSDHDGSQQTFTVALDDGDDRRVDRTEAPVATSTTFESVSYGEYDLEVSVDDDAYLPVSRSLSVSEDATLDVELERQSVIDRVCDDRAAVEAQLDTVADTLAERYDDANHLSPEMDIPVADEYVPCLLAVWAESANCDVRIDDGRVLVYDHEAVTQEVVFAVRETVVEGDDALSYDALRSRYLAVPVSDELIRQVIRDSELDAAAGPREVTPA